APQGTTPEGCWQVAGARPAGGRFPSGGRRNPAAGFRLGPQVAAGRGRQPHVHLPGAYLPGGRTATWSGVPAGFRQSRPERECPGRPPRIGRPGPASASPGSLQHPCPSPEAAKHGPLRGAPSLPSLISDASREILIELTSSFLIL